jgi:hypothetical protein
VGVFFVQPSPPPPPTHTHRATSSVCQAQRVRDLGGLLDPRSPREEGRTPLQTRVSALVAVAEAVEQPRPQRRASHTLDFDAIAESPMKSAPPAGGALEPLPEMPSPSTTLSVEAVIAAPAFVAAAAAAAAAAAPSVLHAEPAMQPTPSVGAVSTKENVTVPVMVLASPAKTKARRALGSLSSNVSTAETRATKQAQHSSPASKSTRTGLSQRSNSRSHDLQIGASFTVA